MKLSITLPKKSITRPTTFAIALILLTFTTSSFSQNNALEIEQAFLFQKNDLSALEINTEQLKLNNNLSQSLTSHIVHSSEAYSIANIKEIQTRIAAEANKAQPNLELTLNTFTNQKPLNLSINSIKNIAGRYILRGKVTGMKQSKVKLVAYQQQLSGRITLDARKRVLVIRSLASGISANYEIDTSDITYD